MITPRCFSEEPDEKKLKTIDNRDSDINIEFERSLDKRHGSNGAENRIQ
jgi:hypothetical protein